MARLLLTAVAVGSLAKPCLAATPFTFAAKGGGWTIAAAAGRAGTCTVACVLSDNRGNRDRVVCSAKLSGKEGATPACEGFQAAATGPQQRSSSGSAGMMSLDLSFHSEPGRGPSAGGWSAAIPHLARAAAGTSEPRVLRDLNEHDAIWQGWCLQAEFAPVAEPIRPHSTMTPLTPCDFT